MPLDATEPRRPTITDLCDDILERISIHVAQERAKRHEAATTIANAWRDMRERRYQALEDAELAKWEMQFQPDPSDEDVEEWGEERANGEFDDLCGGGYDYD